MVIHIEIHIEPDYIRQSMNSTCLGD